MSGGVFVGVMVALALWFSPAIIAGLKGGVGAGVGWAIGLTGLGLVSLICPPFGFLWLGALLAALARPSQLYY